MISDIAGAFHLANSLPWQSKSRFLFLIADAPCHVRLYLTFFIDWLTFFYLLQGKKYHSTGDTYPNGDPLGIHVEKELSN